MTGSATHQEIRRLASRQHGVVSRAQLLGLGAGRELVGHALRTGVLLPIFPGVYAVGRPCDSYAAAWMAATLSAGPSAALAHESAAAAWGFMKPNDLIEVSRVEPHRLLKRGAAPYHSRIRLLGRTSNLLPSERTYRGPIPIMSVAGTLVQLAGSLPPVKFERAFIEASRNGLVGGRTLGRCAEIGQGYKGAAELRRLIKDWNPGLTRTKSVLEGKFLLLCSRSGIEQPEVNVPVCGFEVDCLWRAQKVIVELDGRAFHGDAFAGKRDPRKQNRLIASGYRVSRWTWEMVVNDPHPSIRDLKDALNIPVGRMS